MKTVGIVCEYNPFHNGHKRQLDVLRENGAELIICAMSGNFTERGELAIADKYVRAEAAVRCGADVVVELPFPFSSLSAEGFAMAGVHILASLGVDTLSFGSESGDIELLRRAAKIAMSDEFISAYSEASEGSGSARAYFNTLSAFLGSDTKLSSNDILGISYLCAIEKQGLGIDVFPVKRLGMDYKDSVLKSVMLPSATAIRDAVKSRLFGGSSSTLDEYIPKEALDTFIKASTDRLAPVFVDNVGKEILSFFKLMTPEEITSRAIARSGGGNCVAEDGCGIVERLCRSAHASEDIAVFFDRAYNSRYTDARINRVILFSLLGVSNLFAKALPEYSCLLAANKNGREYLSQLRKSESFPIVTKPADAPEDDVVTKLSRSADELYCCAMPDPQCDGFFVKKRPFIS